MLLDRLEIAELPVVAFSAGSSSAVQLALRHPERVSRLVLISPNSPHPEPLPKPPRLLAPIIFSQPFFSAMRLLARSLLEGLSGTPAGFVPDERERAALREIVDGLFPVGPRARGTIYDGYIGNLDIATYPFASLTVPTLVVAAEDDTLAPYEDSRAMAARIPGAQFVSVRRGGHTLTQLDPGARQAVADFIHAARGAAADDSRHSPKEADQSWAPISSTSSASRSGSRSGALASRPIVLDRAWVRVRDLPVIAKPVVWVALLPCLSGLAVWESNWRTPRARRIAVALVALAFIVFWSSVTFGGG